MRMDNTPSSVRCLGTIMIEGVQHTSQASQVCDGTGHDAMLCPAEDQSWNVLFRVWPIDKNSSWLVRYLEPLQNNF